jgi:hypothetical protein
MDVKKLQESHLRDLISQNYAPAANLQEADLCISTLDLFERFSRSFPSLELSLELTYKLMLDMGFTMMEGGEMEFVWAVREL